MQIRNPKLEIRNKPEIRNSKSETNPKTSITEPRVFFWSFWISDFEFVSDFEIRVSDFPRSGYGTIYANPKSETRNPKQTRNPNTEIRNKSQNLNHRSLRVFLELLDFGF